MRELKIDRSFIMQMTENPDHATIVRSTIELARNLHLEVVAEGVETADHLETLTEYRCPTAQGYHLSHPVPANELARSLARGSRHDYTQRIRGRRQPRADHALIRRRAQPAVDAHDVADAIVFLATPAQFRSSRARR